MQANAEILGVELLDQGWYRPLVMYLSESRDGDALE